jgi:hypothetical protein
VTAATRSTIPFGKIKDFIPNGIGFPSPAPHLLRGMPPIQLGRLAEAASDVKFPEGHRIFGDGGHAAAFWLIQCGHVSLDMQVPGEGPVIIDSIGMGELLGLSWLFPPYRWSFGAVCASPVEAFQFDAGYSAQCTPSALLKAGARVEDLTVMTADSPRTDRAGLPA